MLFVTNPGKKIVLKSIGNRLDLYYKVLYTQAIYGILLNKTNCKDSWS